MLLFATYFIYMFRLGILVWGFTLGSCKVGGAMSFFVSQMPVQGFLASEELFPAPLYVAASSAVLSNLT